MEMTAEHAFLPDIFFFLTFEKKQMINQDSVVMQVKCRCFMEVAISVWDAKNVDVPVFF